MHVLSLQQSQSIEVIEEQLKCSLQASSSGHSGGEVGTTSREFEFNFQFPVAPHLLSCQISTN